MIINPLTLSHTYRGTIWIRDSLTLGYLASLCCTWYIARIAEHQVYCYASTFARNLKTLSDAAFKNKSWICMQVLIMQAPLVFDSQAHTRLNIRPKALMPTHRVVCYTLDFQQVCHLPRIDL